MMLLSPDCSPRLPVWWKTMSRTLPAFRWVGLYYAEYWTIQSHWHGKFMKLGNHLCRSQLTRANASGCFWDPKFRTEVTSTLVAFWISILFFQINHGKNCCLEQFGRVEILHLRDGWGHSGDEEIVVQKFWKSCVFAYQTNSLGTSTMTLIDLNPFLFRVR